MEASAGTIILLICSSVFNAIEANLGVYLNDQRRSDGSYLNLVPPLQPDTEFGGSISDKQFIQFRIHSFPSTKDSNELPQDDLGSDESFEVFTSKEYSQPGVQQDIQSDIDLEARKVPDTISYQLLQSILLHRFDKDQGLSQSGFPKTEFAAPGNQPREVQQLSWNLPQLPSIPRPLKPISTNLNAHDSFADNYVSSRVDDTYSVLTRKARHAILESETILPQESKNETVSATVFSLEMNDTQSKNETEAEMALDLLKEGERRLNSSSFPESAVLILGNTGSGKSTLTQFLTGDGENLISFEDVPGSGDFVINDTLGLISNASTITSWTVFPESMVDSNTNTTFYDCPGFSDTRGVAHDITTTYFTKELLKRLEKVKLIFTINHSSVRIGVDRQDFMTFAEHVITVVKDVEKYNDSIALIVTKVENQYRKGALVPDEKVVESVAGFLKIVRAELHRKMQMNETFAEAKRKATSILKLIDVLLQQKGQSYVKIGIFRRPDEPGPLSEVNSLRGGKKLMEKLIYVNTDYATCNESDFGQTISCKSRNSLHTLVKKIKERISTNVERLQRDILKHFSSIEEQLNDFQYLYELFQRSYSTFSFTYENATSPGGFVRQVSHDLRDLNVSYSEAHLTSILKFDDYLTFCESYGAPRGKPSEWIYKFKPVVETFNVTDSYYKYLVQLYGVLSSYDVQMDIDNFFTLANDYFLRSNTSESQERRIIDGLLGILQKKNIEISDNQLSNIKRLDVSSVKFKKLELLTEFALKPNVGVFCDKSNQRLIVKGHFVKLSDVITALSVCQVSFIDIFALEKVLFDQDLDLTGKEVQVSVIAPTWDSIGNRFLKLDGAEGTFQGPKPSYQSKWIQSGSWSLWRGIQEKSIESKVELKREPGSPGNPGYPAGSFFGVGRKFENTKFLKISSVGGKGGRGQNGTDGIDGKDGSVPKLIDSSLNWPEEHECKDASDYVNGYGRKYNRKVCTVTGFECGNGTSGTDGGIGGKGGKAGQIRLVGVSEGDLVQQVKDGENGPDGAGGKSGKAGMTGKGKRFEKYRQNNKYYDYDYGSIQYKYLELDSWNLRECSAGISGVSGNIRDGAREPRESRKLQDVANVVQNFKDFARGHLNGSVRLTHIQTFLNEYILKLNLDEMVVIADDTTFANIS